MSQHSPDGRRAAGRGPLRFKELRKYSLGAKDGEIGRLDDLYFDAESWTVRHLAVDTSGWLASHVVLIPPGAVQSVDRTAEQLLTDLTRRQIEESPDIGTARPVSRQQELGIYGYYGLPYYGLGPYRWGPLLYPAEPLASGIDVPALDPRRGAEDPQLRSARDVSGYGIQASDGELGHVVDFLVELESWTIRYLVVDPRSWWPGKHVLMPTEWIRGVQWDSASVTVEVTREGVRNAPAYDPSEPLTREFEERYHSHYERAGYWDRSPESWRL